MRLIIIFLFSVSAFGQVNFSAYGVTNNGTTDDDTAELQSALDSESNLIADANATFFISSKLDIDTRVGQTIDWNGATIITNSALNPAINIDKKTVNGGVTTMTDLTLDGNDVVVRGINMESKVVFNNVDVQDLNQNSQGTVSPAGFYIRVKNDSDSMGDWEFNNCDISNLVGTSEGPNSNCVVASNTDGSVNGVLFYWDVAPSIETVLTWNNLNVDGMWGDDGGCFFINDNANIKSTTSKHVVNGGSMRNFERRALKGFSSNMEFNGVTFEAPLASNPNIQCGTISGMVVFGSGDRENIHFDGCTFIGTSYEARVIPIAVRNWSITNSTFLGSYSWKSIDMTDVTGAGVFDGVIECNTFASGHEIGEYTSNSNWTDGSINIGGNTWADGSPNISLLPADYNTTTPNCSTGGGAGTTPTDPEPTPQTNRIKALRKLTNILING